MKIIGIIAEYNPFHLGHLYQINKIKEMFPDSLIIVVVSTNFTERGDISIINKWDKTRICLENNVDLIVELPTLYATQSADIFAWGALKILNELKIDTLVFGSETDDVEVFKDLAKIQLDNLEYDKTVKSYLSDGLNYPSAMSKALQDISKIKIDKPNDLLGLSYVKEIIKNKYLIKPISIKRTNDYHGETIYNELINASLIRKLYNNNHDISSYVPKQSLNYLYKDINLNKIFDYLRITIIANQGHLSEYLTVDEGIENRIIKNIYLATSYDDLINKIKTKRYTYNKLNRMFIHILLGIKKTDNNQDLYIRILGFNSKGKDYLNTINKDFKLPVFSGYKKDKSNALNIELKSTYIYSIIVNDDNLISLEFKNRPIIK